MKIKTADLIGPALDWAVGAAFEMPVEVCQIFQYGRPNGKHYISIGETDKDGAEVDFEPSEEWSQGGPIIERESVEVVRGNALIFPKGNEKGEYSEPLWLASYGGGRKFHGPTPLIAAMRCVVASRLGDEVDIPEELL